MRILFACLLLCLSGPASAQNVTQLQRTELSLELFRIGVFEGNAVLLLAAARLRKDAGIDQGQGFVLDWRKMLQAAEDLSGGDPAMELLIDDLRSESSRGVASGPVYSIRELAGAQDDMLSDLEFAGGRYAEVYIEGAGAANLDLFIHDGEGQLVCADTDAGDIAYCGWEPAQTGGFTVTVRNTGTLANSYALMTN